MRLTQRSILVLLLAFTGVACRGRGGGHDAQIATTQPSDAVIAYHRTGGLAGTGDWIVISPDGQMKVSGRILGDYTVQLPEGTVGKLESRMQGWKKLKPNYPAERGVRDDFQIAIRYGGRTVVASDTARDVPAEFERARDMLEGLAHTLKPANATTTTPSPPPPSQ